MEYADKLQMNRIEERLDIIHNNILALTSKLAPELIEAAKKKVEGEKQ